MTDATKLAIDFLHCVDQRFDLAKEPHAPGVTMLDQFHAALAALRAQPAGWIAVSERLPKPWDAVMVHPRPNDYVNEAYLNHKGVWMYSEYVTDFGDQAYPCVVTHWMPLPPPPGQERAQPAEPLVFGMRGPKMTFTIGNQSFTLDYEPETTDEYVFMGNMLKAAISKLPLGVKIGAQPDHSDQHLEMVAAARAVVERWDTPLWKDAPATAGFINRLRDALPPAIGETME